MRTRLVIDFKHMRRKADTALGSIYNEVHLVQDKHWITQCSIISSSLWEEVDLPVSCQHCLLVRHRLLMEAKFL